MLEVAFLMRLYYNKQYVKLFVLNHRYVYMVDDLSVSIVKSGNGSTKLFSVWQGQEERRCNGWT